MLASSKAATTSTQYSHLDDVTFAKTVFAQKMQEQDVADLRVLARVFPFRVSPYVLSDLINWDDYQRDPIYRMVFPAREMLPHQEFRRLERMLHATMASDSEIRTEVYRIRAEMNPHPGGQVELNLPTLDGVRLSGIQHKYRDVILFFPAAGQTCHTYCPFCFRWAQFVDGNHVKFAEREVSVLLRYLDQQPLVRDVLFTGGDPFVMSARMLNRYVKPLLDRKRPQIQVIRFGTKALGYWPYRFFADDDSTELLELFENIVASGIQCVIMLHNSHARELSTGPAREALAQLRGVGVTLRSQGAIVRGVNDDSDTWADLWEQEERESIQPCYAYQVRNTGAHRFFRVSIAKAFGIMHVARLRVPKNVPTPRAPVMSTSRGKIQIIDVRKVGADRVVEMKVIRCPNEEVVGTTFVGRLRDDSGWIDEVEPINGVDPSLFSA